MFTTDEGRDLNFDSPQTKNGGNATVYKALGPPNIVIKAFEQNERKKME